MAIGDLKKSSGRGESVYLLAICTFVSLMIKTSTANVVLIGKNVTLSFDDVAAKFTPAVKGSGECGSLYLAEPLDACSPLTNKFDPVERGLSSPFALIVRGGCTFEDKVRKAQKAGFKAAIVYDDEVDGGLVAMAGSSAGIKVHAVFISKASGEVLKKYAGNTNMVLWIIPTFENSAWSIMAISFICLLAMSAVMATCFFIRRHRTRRELPRAPRVREFHGMGRRLVKAMPSLIFTAVLEDNSTSRTCAICLEDYSVGEKLRILPCRHKFHAVCVDSWLTTWRTFCPVCKRDASTSTGDPPASESTPLLSSSPISISSSIGILSVRSSLASSAAIQIASQPSFSPSGSHARSFSSTPRVSQYLRSHGNSPAIIDLRNASSQRSHISHLVSPHSYGYPSLSPLNSRYLSPFIPSSSNASPSYLGSCSGPHPRPLHCSESATTFSPYSSAQSLPGC